MAIFAPNANSYRRFQAGAYAPGSPTWGYNHREVALRIPVSSDSNRRIEHRVAGADANPYLVMAAILAGIHHGISQQCDPGPEIAPGTDLSGAAVTLPNRWDKALELFRESKVLPRYLGSDYCEAFAVLRQGESDDFTPGSATSTTSGTCGPCSEFNHSNRGTSPGGTERGSGR